MGKSTINCNFQYVSLPEGNQNGSSVASIVISPRNNGRLQLLVYTESSFVEQTTPGAFTVTDQRLDIWNIFMDSNWKTYGTYGTFMNELWENHGKSDYGQFVEKKWNFCSAMVLGIVFLALQVDIHGCSWMLVGAIIQQKWFNMSQSFWVGHHRNLPRKRIIREHGAVAKSCLVWTHFKHVWACCLSHNHLVPTKFFGCSLSPIAFHGLSLPLRNHLGFGRPTYSGSTNAACSSHLADKSNWASW